MQHITWLVAIFISMLVNMALAQSTLPPTSRTVYKCNEKGKTVYSDAPCLGATKVDVEPTRGFNKDTGREIIGNDVRREKRSEMMAEAIKPLTGMNADQYKVYERRYKLSPESKQACKRLDQLIPQAEFTEKHASPEELATAKNNLFVLRKSYSKNGC
jgi:hypothetical protein